MMAAIVLHRSWRFMGDIYPARQKYLELDINNLYRTYGYFIDFLMYLLDDRPQR